MDDRIRALTREMELNGSAGEAILSQLPEELGFAVPEDYLQFARETNGGEGPVGQSGYLVLWPLQDIAEQNRQLRVRDFAPGLVVFGTDGGNEAYAFDTREGGVRYVQVPLIPLDLQHARRLGSSFREFLEFLHGER